MSKTYLHIPVEGKPVTFAVDGQNELAQLQEKVGGYIEGVDCRDGSRLYVNEEGHLLSLPINQGASALAGSLIVGDAVLTGGINDDTGEDRGLTLKKLRDLGVEK